MKHARNPRRNATRGWKDIAAYLGKGVRTVQRYERELGLPIRRPAGKSTGSVMATKAELDGWVVASPIQEAFRLPQAPVDIAMPLSEFRCQLKQMRRLREEAAELRTALRASLELLYANLRLALPQLDQTQERSSRHRLVADVQPFDPKNTVN